MSDLPSTNSKIQIEETTYRAPVSETLTQRMGGSINYALDQVAANATAISTEAIDRANADSGIYSILNSKTVLRQSENTSGTLTFNSNSVYADGQIIETLTININHANTTNTWALLQIRADADNTTAPRVASYLDIDLLSDDAYGTQNLCEITSSAGEHFGTVICLGNYSTPLQIRVRQIASASISGTGTRWTWQTAIRWLTIDSQAVFNT